MKHFGIILFLISGTGAFLLMNTGDKCIPSTKGLITTVGYKLGDQPACYALEVGTTRRPYRTTTID
jgi:hypothetical protein